MKRKQLKKKYDRGYCHCGKWLGVGHIDETAPQFCSVKCKKAYKAEHEYIIKINKNVPTGTKFDYKIR